MNRVAITAIILVLISFKSIFGAPVSFKKVPLDSFEFHKIEIIDSSICVVLDSIIAYEKYCLKKKSRLITYYDIVPTINESTRRTELTAYSSMDGFDFALDSLSDAGVLFYRNRYFVFEAFTQSKGLERYLKLSSSTEVVHVTIKKKVNLGKTYSVIGITMNSESIQIDFCACACYRGYLNYFSRNYVLRNFFYNLFCPCRGSRKV